MGWAEHTWVFIAFVVVVSACWLLAILWAATAIGGRDDELWGRDEVSTDEEDR